MSDAETELFKLHRQGQEKNDYFLLAAAGTAIGFALSQTKTAALEWSHAPLGVALFCWGVSFFAGCRRLAYVEDTLWTNGELLRIKAGGHPLVGPHPAMIAEAAQTIREKIHRKGHRAQGWGRWQFQLLISGALSYVGWHVLEMYLRA